VFTLRIRKEYDKTVLPHLCGNIDCQCPLEQPLGWYDITRDDHHGKLKIRTCLCQFCSEHIRNHQKFMLIVSQ